MTSVSAMTIEPADEQALQHRLEQGDTSAFWELWEHYRTSRLQGYSLQWMQGNLADAEDALSSSSLKAYQYLAMDAQKVVNLKSWLSRLLRNHCIDTWKTRQRQAQCVGDITYLAEHTCASRVSQRQRSAEELLLQHELGAHIHQAFHTLPPRLRKPSLLRFVHHMPYADIAARLNLRPDNVRKRIQQARQLLQQQLSPYRDDDPMVTKLQLNVNAPEANDLLIEAEELTHLEVEPDLPAYPLIASRTFQLTLPDGVEKQLLLLLDHQPKRLQQKITTLRKYIHKHPEGWKKRRELADLLYAEGNWQEALSTYRQVLHKRPDCLPVWRRVGDMLCKLGQADEAGAAYEQASEYARDAAARHHINGLNAACQRRDSTAAQHLETAASLEPHNPVHQQALGLLHLQAARPIEACEQFDARLQDDPDDLVALTHSYEALCAAGRDADARHRTAHAVELDPNHVLALTRLARHLNTAAQGTDAPKSRELLQRATQLAPDAPDVHASWAYYHRVRGEIAQSRAILQQFTTRRPSCPEGWYHAAVWHAQSGDIAAASHAIQQAYELDPEDAAIMQAACDIWLDVTHRSQLQSLIQHMIQDAPEDWRLQTAAGAALIRCGGESKLAVDVSARGPQLQPRLPQAWFRYGQVLARAGRHQDAIHAFQEGWAWLPTQDGYTQSTLAAGWMSTCYANLGDHTSAHMWWTTTQQLALNLTATHPALGSYWQRAACKGLRKSA